MLILACQNPDSGKIHFTDGPIQEAHTCPPSNLLLSYNLPSDIQMRWATSSWNLVIHKIAAKKYINSCVMTFFCCFTTWMKPCSPTYFWFITNTNGLCTPPSTQLELQPLYQEQNTSCQVAHQGALLLSPLWAVITQFAHKCRNVNMGFQKLETITFDLMYVDKWRLSK